MATKTKKDKPELTQEEKEQRQRVKAAKFIELAEARVGNTLKRLGHVSNLANRNTYVYTQEQAQKIVKALRDAVDRVEMAFEPRGEKSDLFTL